MKTRYALFTPIALLLAHGIALADGSRAEAPDVHAILSEFVQDYRSDRMSRPMVFGIEVQGAEEPRWHVVVGERADDGLAPVELRRGFPDEPALYFTTDLETLLMIHRGELSSLTAMAKAFSSDAAPLDIGVVEGFTPDERSIPDIIATAFHFWTMGAPEIVRFGDLSNTRQVHGGAATVFYYQPGFRSAYFMIRPGDHVNEDPRSQTNPFPTLLVVTKGQGAARIGGVETSIRAGESVFIGPEVTHEFWVDGASDEGVEGVLLMFGDGA